MIWILWHRRIGDLNQMQDLVHALGQPCVVKKLKFKWPLYAPLAQLSAGSDGLSAPWPEMIFCAEALCSVIARKLKKRSGGKIKIVCLARPSGDVRSFDLVLTTAQYRLPKLPHVVELMLPLTAKSDEGGSVKSKSLAVLIGASTPPEVLNVAVAQKIAMEIKATASARSLKLNVVTSPRTVPAVAAVFSNEIAPPHTVYLWSPLQENPYQQCLSDAAEIIVTSDSASMLADAIATGKPVQVYRLLRQFTFAQQAVEWLFCRWPDNWIFRSGLIEPATNRWLLIEKLLAKKHISLLGDAAIQHCPFDPQSDIDLAVAAVRRLG